MGGQPVSVNRLSKERKTGRHTSEDLQAAAPKEGLPKHHISIVKGVIISLISFTRFQVSRVS